MQLTSWPSTITHALVHSGPAPAPGSIRHCAAVRRVAGKTFFDVQTIDGVVITSEFVAGHAPSKGDAMRCTRRSGTYFAVELAHDAPLPMRAPFKLDQVLALCESLGMQRLHHTL